MKYSYSVKENLDYSIPRKLKIWRGGLYLDTVQWWSLQIVIFTGFATFFQWLLFCHFQNKLFLFQITFQKQLSMRMQLEMRFASNKLRKIVFWNIFLVWKERSKGKFWNPLRFEEYLRVFCTISWVPGEVYMYVDKIYMCTLSCKPFLCHVTVI
jgi:hypothetical protein